MSAGSRALVTASAALVCLLPRATAAWGCAPPGAQPQLAQVEQLQGRGDLAAARSAVRVALECAEGPARVSWLIQLGSITGDQGAWSEAFEAFAEAARLAAADDDRQVGRLHAGLGLAHWKRAEYSQAEAQCAAARQLGLGSGDEEGQARALLCLGHVAFKQGQYVAALERYEAALALEAGRGSVAGSVEAHEALALWSLERRAHADALAHYQRALEIASAGEEPGLRCHLLAALGFLYQRQGATAEALRFEDQALHLSEQLRDDGCRAEALSKSAGAHLALDDPAEALRRYGEVLALRRKLGAPREEAWTWARIARVRAARGQGAQSLAALHEAVALFERLDDRRALAWHVGEIAAAYERQGNDTQALAWYQQALAHQQEVRLPYVSLSLGALARLHARAGRAEQAREHARQALEAAERADNPEMRWQAAYDEARVERRLGRPAEALLALRRSLVIIEALRAQTTPDDEAKAAWLEDKQQVYTDAIELLLELGQTGEALEVAERSRARALLDWLEGEPPAATSSPHPEGGGPAAEGTWAQGSAEALAPLQRGAHAAGGALVKALGDPSGPGNPALAEPPTLTALLAEARRQHGTLVEYVLGARQVHAFVVPPEGDLHATSTALRGLDLGELVDGLRAGPGLDPAGRRARLRRLHRLLIEPIESWLPGDPEALVTIVPHRALFRLPFAALLDARGRYLVESHTLRYGPSLGALSRLPPRAPNDEPGSALLVANPSMPRLPGRTQTLPSLPGAEREVRAIARLLGGEHTLVLVGPAAGEGRVRAELKGRTLVHLATHGIARPDRPLDSLLALAPDGRLAPDAHPGAGAPGAPASPWTADGPGPGGGDGLLTAREVMGLGLRADLVTLSACDSGLGQLASEGVLGLSRAFLLAGARAVLVSLWRVADEAARYEMERFYRGLAAGPAQALRRAQLDTLQALRAGRIRTPSGQVLPEDPAYWAPFVLVGRAE